MSKGNKPGTGQTQQAPQRPTADVDDEDQDEMAEGGDRPMRFSPSAVKDLRRQERNRFDQLASLEVKSTGGVNMPRSNSGGSRSSGSGSRSSSSSGSSRSTRPGAPAGQEQDRPHRAAVRGMGEAARAADRGLAMGAARGEVTAKEATRIKPDLPLDPRSPRGCGRQLEPRRRGEISLDQKHRTSGSTRSGRRPSSHFCRSMWGAILAGTVVTLAVHVTLTFSVQESDSA